MVAVIGSSGSGKSSVIFAGLIPKLRAEGIWLIESFRPQSQPFYLLASALVRLLKPELDETQHPGCAAELFADMTQGKLTAPQIVASILERHANKRLLLVVDQFEELYTLYQNKNIPEKQQQEEQQRFVDVLLAMIQSAPRKLTVILTLRVDFLSYVLDYPPFGKALKDSLLPLSAMSDEEMQAAIKRPAQQMQVQIEKGLTDWILNDVKQKSGKLPLLEFALTRLWAKQSQGKLTNLAYQEIGGVAKALAEHAEDVYTRLTEAEQKQAQRIFLQLVRPGEGTEDTRRLATCAEVGNWKLVTFLAGAEARLVVTGRDEKTGEEKVELVHEVLIQEWQRLKEWIDDNKRELIQIRRIEDLAKDWECNDEDSDLLLKGKRLKEFKELGQKIKRIKRRDFGIEIITLTQNIKPIIVRILDLLLPKIGSQLLPLDNEPEKDKPDILSDRAKTFLLKSYPSLREKIDFFFKERLEITIFIIIFIIVLLIINAVYVIVKRTNNYKQFENFNKFISETRKQCQNLEVKRKIEEQAERGGNLSNYDFSCRYLEGIDLGRTILRKTKFNHANLKNANFLSDDLSDASLQDADLSNANLGFTDLRGANLNNAILSNANLKGALFNKKTKIPFSRDVAIASQQMYEIAPNANLTNADLRTADLTNTDLRGANLTNADLRGANLTNADLRGANLTNADLESTTLWGVKLTNANLESAHLINASLGGAHLSNTNLSNANLNNSNLGGADLTKTNLKSTNLNNANLNKASLRGADLNKASLRGANLTNANLTDANLSDTDLGYASLRSTYLNNTNLTDANLSGTDLTGTDLTNANLRGADLGDAKLERAKLDQKKIQAAYNWRKACHNKEFRKRLGLSTKNPNRCISESDKDQLFDMLLYTSLGVTIILWLGYQFWKKYLNKQT